MRVPTRSAGTRSGVNCRRLNEPPSTSATVLTVSVLASPGRPSSSTWPPASSATSTRSSIASWPTITRLISNSAVSRASWASRDGLGSSGRSSAWSRRSSGVTCNLLGSSGSAARRRVRTLSEVHSQGTPRAAAFHRHFGLFSRPARGNRRGHVLRGGDLLVVDGDDLVARLHAAAGGGAARNDRVHDRAGAVRRRAVAAPEVAALNRPAALDLGHDELHGRDRYGEADARVGIAARLDLGVHADDAAVAVEQRAAGVAGVDRRVGLHGVGDREAVRGVDRAPERGDDAGRDRALEAERRADGDRLVTGFELGRVAERERLQAAPHLAGIDLEDREVRRRVLADERRRDDLAVGADAHLEGARPFDYMVVGDDVAGRVVDEARAGRGLACLDEDDAGRDALVELRDVGRLGRRRTASGCAGRGGWRRGG